jgi:hypothetical protein
MQIEYSPHIGSLVSVEKLVLVREVVIRWVLPAHHLPAPGQIGPLGLGLDPLSLGLGLSSQAGREVFAEGNLGLGLSPQKALGPLLYLGLLGLSLPGQLLQMADENILRCGEVQRRSPEGPQRLRIGKHGDGRCVPHAVVFLQNAAGEVFKGWRLV